MKSHFVPLGNVSSTGKPVAWAYSRFSTPGQARGDSERRQRSSVEAWKQRNPNYEVHALHDAGVSAYHGRNRTLGQLGIFLGALRNNELGREPVLLVENLDRLSREEIETAHAFFLELINRGAAVVTLHNDKCYRKGMSLVDIITALVEMDVAHQHSAKLSMRVKEACKARREKGLIVHTGSSAPAWLTLAKGRTAWSVRKDREKLLHRIFERAAAGKGPQAIARELNSEGVAPWSRSKAWRGSTIDGLLRSRAVLGEYKSKPGYFPSVVDQDLWSRANDRELKKARGRGTGTIAELNLFRGLVRSGLDGSLMILRQSGVKDRTGAYVWHRYLVSNETVAGRSKHRIRYEDFEASVLRFFRQVDRELLNRVRSGANTDLQERVAAAERQVQTLEKQIAKLNRFILLEDQPPKSVLATLHTLEDELQEAERKREALTQAKAKVVERPRVTAEMNLCDPEVRRAVRADIARWCQEIEVFRDHCVVWLGSEGFVIHFPDAVESSEGYTIVTRDQVAGRSRDTEPDGFETGEAASARKSASGDRIEITIPLLPRKSTRRRRTSGAIPDAANTKRAKAGALRRRR